MKALILAAGRGSRLIPLTDERPKSLISVNGKPILFKQIENLLENNINEITIISGYLADFLEHSIHEKWPEIKIVQSIDYANTNNMYSAYIGIQHMFPNKVFEPFLMMNGDVFYDSSVIKALLNSIYSNAIVVDIGRYLEESMKVIEKENRIVAISKSISRDQALGSSIDVYKFNEEGGKSFFRQCVNYIERKKELNKWSEVALQDALSDSDFKVCPLLGRWLEIDTCEDLAAAEALFKDK